MKVSSVVALAIVAMSGPASAQSGSGTTIAVSRITSTETCAYFQNSAGRAAVAANRWAVAAAVSWRTWWVKDCETNFATMRSSLESALAAAPNMRVGRTGRYAVSLNLTQVNDADVPAPQAPTGGDFGVAQSFLSVSFDLAVRDGAGRSVFGALMTKKIEIGSDIRADNFRASSTASGDAAYGRLQNEVALAAARAVAFHFEPIRVLSNEAREVQVNYGAPYLKLGDLLMVSSPDRRTTIRYRVTSASANAATAQVEGDGDVSRIAPGSLATYVEAEDPMQNGRRFRKVDLP
jgi:hypothetical protein